MRRTLLAALGVLSFSVAPVWAQTPTSRQTLNLQGRLTDNTGACLTGSYTFLIEIYDDPTAGSILFSESQPGTPVTDGIYNIEIGKLTGGGIPSAAFSGCPDLWIQITIQGEALSPRTHLTSVAYAYCANLLDGMDSTAFATATTAAILGGNSPGGTLTIGTNDANALAFETAGTDRMWINAAGNVGIGPVPAVSPTAPLTVVSTSGPMVEFDSYGSSPIVKLRHANGTVATPTATLLNDSLGVLSMSGYATTGFVGPGKASLRGIAAENWTDAAQGAHVAISTTPIGTATSAERLRITEAGNVGIGTMTPSGILHGVRNINGVLLSGFENPSGGGAALNEFRIGQDIVTSNSSYVSLGYVNAGFAASGYTNPNQVNLTAAQNAGNGIAIVTNAAAPIKFVTNGGGGNNERMRIDGAGNVGIGTAAPGQLLDVNGNTNISGNLTVTGTISQAGAGGDFVKKAGDSMSGILTINAGLSVPGTAVADAFSIDSDSSLADTVNICTDGAGAADTIAIGAFTDTIYIDTAGAGTSIEISNDGGSDTINLGSPGDDLSIAATLRNPIPLKFDGLTVDANTTSFVITDPLAPRTITFPDADGTVALLDGVGNLKIPGGILEAGAAALLQLRGDGNVNIHLDENNDDPNALWSVLNGANASLMTAAEDGTITLGLSGTASNISLGGNAADTLNIGSNGAGGDTITLGASQVGSSTSINTLTIGLGTTANGHTITIGATGGGSSTALNADNVSIGTTGNARTIGIGGTGSNAADSIDIGTGGGGDFITLGSDGDASAATINLRPGTGGTITLGNGAAADTINIGGAAGTHTINIGTGGGIDTITLGGATDTINVGDKLTWADANGTTDGNGVNDAGPGDVTANGVVGTITLLAGDAAQQTFTVKDNKVTGSSHVFVEITTSSSTQAVAKVSPAAGEFTVVFTAGLGAGMTFAYLVIN